MRAWLGQVPLLKRRGPELLGGARHRHSLGRNCCVANGQLQCTDPLWISPPGNYPGYPECGAGGPGAGGVPAPGGGTSAPGGTGTGPGGGGQQCPPDAQGNPQFWDGTQCRPSVGNIPGGGITGVPNPAPGGGTQAPGGTPGAYPVVGGCQVPPLYAPQPQGGAANGGMVLACKLPDGKFEVRPYGGGPPIVTGVDQACLNQFGDVTMAQEGDGRCVGGPTGGAQNQIATGACALPTGKKWIKCPPSNGVTADYYLDAETGSYAPNMTTQSPECANSQDVIQVGANSPYCDGGQVWGDGNALPTLVACYYMPGNTFEESRVIVHGGPNFEVLASDIMLKDIPAKFPGQRYMYVRQERCSPLPDFGIAAAAPAPTPAPTPAPAPTPPTLPTTPMQQPESALPPQQTMTYPTQPTGSWSGSPFGAPPSGFPQAPQMMPAVAPPPMAPPPAAAPPPAQLAPIPCPARLKVADWSLRCVTGV